MINKPPCFKGLDIRISIVISMRGSGFITHGSTLGLRVLRCEGLGIRYLGFRVLGFRVGGFRVTSLGFRV